MISFVFEKRLKNKGKNMREILRLKSEIRRVVNSKFTSQDIAVLVVLPISFEDER